MIGVLSSGIWKIPALAAFLEQPVKRLSPLWGSTTKLNAIAGWGLRPSTNRARALAARLHLPFISLEDGFLRSVGLGRAGYMPWSIVIDDLGIYYDATRPSRLEALIRDTKLTESRSAEVRRAVELIKKYRLSKYNHAPDFTPSVSSISNNQVLVIDQTLGDLSVNLGGADQNTFYLMLASALEENPHSEVWIKTHPDVAAGKRNGYFSKIDNKRVRFIAEDVSPLSIMKYVDKVYTVTSQMGFEALLLGKKVVSFGLPWYAGWGLTDDRCQRTEILGQRRGPRSIEALVSAAYFDYARYVHPVTKQRCSIFDLIDWLARNKSCCDQLRGKAYCVGMSLWKRSVVMPFLSSPATSLTFVDSLDELNDGLKKKPGKVIVWGGGKEEIRCVADRFSVPFFRLEDGFIRSAGLGSDLRAPLSLALDDTGIYYDPTSGSSLERILNSLVLNEDQTRRVRNLRDDIIRLRISKYNVGNGRIALPSFETKRLVILVPGQVEDDASIRYGSPRVFRNLDLIRIARAARPDAWIIYKPHPDVVAGNRKGAVASEFLVELVDQVVVDADITDCLQLVDEVHTMTSLAGFEALLHGKLVHCYGAPFYAGWGLTVDHVAMPHRKRGLSIEELVFGALCLYPRYRLPGVDGFCEVEDVIGYLQGMLARQGQQSIGSSWFGRQYRKTKEFVNALRALK